MDSGPHSIIGLFLYIVDISILMTTHLDVVQSQ